MVKSSLIELSAPVAVLLTATLPKEVPRELYQASCYGHRWDLGGSFQQGYNDLVVCRWPPDAPLQRSFQTVHVFSEPGTYQVVFELGRRGAAYVATPPLTIVVPAPHPDDPTPNPEEMFRLNSPYNWPGQYRIALGIGVFIFFTYPHPTADWLESATVYHLPSNSRGSVARIFQEKDVWKTSVHVRQDIGTPEGRAIVAAFLDDPEFVNAMAVRIREVWERH